MLGLILILVITLPLAWLASEFQPRKSIRIVLGIAAIGMSFGVAWIAGSFERWNSNIWYGAASKDLVENTIIELENGNADRVLAELRVLRTNLNPTYENRADYDKLIAKYVYAVSDSPTLHERNDPRWADNIPEGGQPSNSESQAAP